MLVFSMYTVFGGLFFFLLWGCRMKLVSGGGGGGGGGGGSGRGWG